MKKAILLVLAATVAGCTTQSSDYALSLSPHDAKWSSPACQQARRAAADYEVQVKTHPGWSTSLLLGPYSLALAASIKDVERERRRVLARDEHLACSSLPLPRDLQREARPMVQTRYP